MPTLQNGFYVFNHSVGLALKGLKHQFVDYKMETARNGLNNITRSSRSQMFFKIDFLRNFAIFTEKHLRVSLFLIKQTCNFIKKRFQYKCFPVNIAKFLRTTFSITNLWWLFLHCTALFIYATITCIIKVHWEKIKRKLLHRWKFDRKVFFKLMS